MRQRRTPSAPSGDPADQTPPASSGDVETPSPPAPSGDGPALETDEPPVPLVVRLTTRASEAFGPGGRFVELTEIEALAAEDGLLAEPTPDQLAQRLT